MPVSVASEHTALGSYRARVVTATWLFLMAATIAGWVLARVGDAQADPIKNAVIVALAAIKIYLVLDIFMGLRHAPNGWRMAVAAWLSITCGAILFFVLQ